MKDYIDERNRKEMMARSIIKRRNIVFKTPEEMERDMRQKQAQQAVMQQDKAEQMKAEDILRRLEEEQQQEELKKQVQIEAMAREQGEAPAEDAPEISESEVERLLADASQEAEEKPEEG